VLDFLALNNFRASGSILTGLLSVDAPRGRGDNSSRIFTMPAPKNLWRPKNRPKFFAIFDNFQLWLRISPEGINISKMGKALDHPPPLPRWTKKLVYFGPQIKKLLTLIYLNPNGLFSRDYISALRGCCALKFLHTLEIDHGLPALTQRGTGVPPPKKKSWKLKIWIKI